MSGKRPQVIVTGAAGFAGQHLVDRLMASSEVHGWALPGTRPGGYDDVRWHDVDVVNKDAVLAAVERIRPDQLYHLAGAPSVETSWQNAVPHLSTNAMGTAHILDALRHHAPTCRVLVVTSAQVYHAGDQPIDEHTPLVPQSPYGLTKLAQDQLAVSAAEADGLDVVIARPFNHIGPKQAPGFAVPSFARQIARIERNLEAPAIRVGNLDTRRDFTDVRDVAAAYEQLMAVGRRGVAYNVCSDSTHRIGDLLTALVGLSEVVITVETDPARLRPADVPVIVGNSGRLRGDTNWAPVIPMATTLADTLAWWRQHEARQA